MIIRKGNLGDIKELHKILNNTKELRGFSKGEAYSVQWVKEVISDRKRNAVLIADENGNMAGFLMMHLLPGKDILINDVYVKPEYRRQGIAKSLLKAVEVISNKIKSELTAGFVLVTNKKMQDLLKSMGHKKEKMFYYYYKESAR